MLAARGLGARGDISACLWGLVILIGVLLSLGATAADLPASDYIDTEVKRLTAVEPQDAKLIRQYQSLGLKIKSIQQFTDEQAKLRALIASFPRQRELMAQKIEQASKNELFEVNALTSNDDLAQALASLRAAISEWRSNYNANTDKIKQLNASRLTLPKQIASLNSQIDDASLVGTDSDDQLQQWLNSANRKVLTVEKGTRLLEQQSLDERSALLKLEQQLLTKKIQLAAPVRIELQNRLARVEQDSVRELIVQAMKLETIYSEVATEAKKDIEQSKRLAQELEQIQIKVETARRQTQELEAQRQLLSAEQKLIKDNLNWLRQSTQFGASLRAQLQRLPSRLDGGHLPDELAQSHIRKYEISQLITRHNLQTVSAIQPEPVTADPVQNALHNIRQFHKQLLLKLGPEYDKLIIELGRLQLVTTQYHNEIHSERVFLREQQLWVRSNLPIWKSVTQFDARVWLGANHSLDAVWGQIPSSERSLFIVALVIYTGGLMVFYRWLTKKKRRLREAYRKVLGHPVKDSFSHTMVLFSCSLLAAVALPLWFSLTTSGLSLLWPLPTSGDLPSLITTCAMGLFVLELIYLLSPPGGLLNVHLNWPAEICTYLHRLTCRLRWPLLVVLLLLYCSELISGEKEAEISRLLFMLLLGGLIYIYTLLLQQKRLPSVMPPPLNHGLALGIIRCALVGSLVAILAIAATGLYLAAWVLLTYQQASIFIMIGALLAYQLGERWFKLEHRQLNYQRLLARREELIAQQRELAEEAPELADLREELPDVEECGLDAEQVSEQSLKLLRGLCVIGFVIALLTLWSSALEMASWLDRVVLWQTSEMGESGIVMVDVTLQSLLYALITVAVTVIAVRNLPGILELLVLRRMDLSPGTGYAITMLIRYLLMTVGVLTACTIIGFQWANLQWLVAAFGVGLGFGLQEIFANFISGLIILFERPIRIGDIVTINDLSGTVSRIKTRATTIIDWDNKEIVVPNKSFLTEKLINWSLTDPITRIVIPIGVAYGSDVDKVEKLLYQVAHEHPLVLKEPSPTVFFLAFGGSSLDFELRVYITAIDYRLSTIHLLNKNIDCLFRQHQIEIAFPQMDIHVRDIPKDSGQTPPPVRD